MMALMCAVVFAMGGLSACSPGEGDDFDAAGPYAAQFRQEYERAKSDYVREVLADGKVDVQELQDAQQHMVSCMEERGYVLFYDVDRYGLSNQTMDMSHGPWDNFTAAEQEEALAAERTCEDAWMGGIGSLYHMVRVNPNDEDWSGLIAACLVRHGLAPEGFTGQDWDDLIGQNATYYDTSTMDPNQPPPNQEPSAPMVLPGGHDMSEPEARKCRIVPLQ
ncbi:MAG: hypothetical protein LBV00_03015 [Propionibacteriaceae bacterium]|nr:hypothetical protein [Propionibacteriaceae bacterium]